MAEYGREQRNQLSRAIVNSEAGSKQLKEFADNRSRIRRSAFSTTIQLDKWKWNFSTGQWIPMPPLGVNAAPAFKPKKCDNGKVYDDVTSTWSEVVTDTSPESEGYQHVGDWMGKSVYAKLSLDGVPEVYKTAMMKGVIASGSTGKDGIKCESYGWVVKITLSQGKKKGEDNTKSLLATVVQVEKMIKLDFDKWYSRH